MIVFLVILHTTYNFITCYNKDYSKQHKGEISTMIIKSPHFGEIQITGEEASSAADWLKSELSEATLAQEILAHQKAIRMFNVKVEATNSHVAQKENILHSLL